MKKKVLSLLLCVAILFCMCSCDSAETGVNINTPVVVAVGTEDSADYFAAKDYIATNGYELVEFQSRQAAILAVENAKADYVVLNDKVATKEFLENTELQWHENLSYKVEYCAVFNQGDEELKELFDTTVAQMKEKGVFEDIQKAYYSGEQHIISNTTGARGTLTVICAPVYEYMLYFGENKELAGCELYVIKEICNALAMDMELYVCEGVEEMYEALEEGKGDVIISSVVYTEERAATYLLSAPYFQTEFGLYKRDY